MKTAIIYHSHSGITRNVVEQLNKEISGEMIEVTPEKPYSSLMVVPKGCYRAGRGLSDDVQPGRIDLSEYDLVVIASPVWAGKPTPVINGAIDGLNHFEGKKTFALMTCGRADSGEKALGVFTQRLTDKGLNLVGSVVLDRNEVKSQDSISRIITDIRSGWVEV